MKKLFFLAAALLIITAACNKEKRYSKRLMKGETWTVLSVSIDGSTSTFDGEWFITSDVDIYDSVPSLQWIADNQDAVCEWQFQNKGKSFQLNYSYLCSEPMATDLDSLDYFSDGLSGTYDVVNHGTRYMEFESMNTKSHAGKPVVIAIRRY